MPILPLIVSGTVIMPGYGILQNANDATVNNNNGAAMGNAAPVIGFIGNAYNFDGSGDYIRIPDNSSLDLSTGLTLSAWIKATAIISYGTEL